eukprot:COSAG04_NODE_3515_length_2749_cov_3.708679_1_plen_187_part_00
MAAPTHAPALKRFLAEAADAAGDTDDARRRVVAGAAANLYHKMAGRGGAAVQPFSPPDWAGIGVRRQDGDTTLGGMELAPHVTPAHAKKAMEYVLEYVDNASAAGWRTLFFYVPDVRGGLKYDMTANFALPRCPGAYCRCCGLVLIKSADHKSRPAERTRHTVALRRLEDEERRRNRRKRAAGKMI